MPAPSRTDQRGVALLATLLLVVLLMVTAVGAFVRTGVELRTANDRAAEVDAFALAQSGLDSFLIAHPSVPATLPDSQAFTFSNGRAVATLRLLRQGSDTVYVIASRGENTTNRTSSTTALARRTVARLVRRSGGGLTANAAWTALSGFDKNGNSGSINGNDHCTTGVAPLPSLPGILVPTVSSGSTAPMYSGKTNPIDGNPDNTPVTMGTPGIAGTAKDAVPVDWAGILNQSSLTPDYYRSSAGAWSPSSPPTSGSAYSVVFVQGDYAGKFPGNERGIFVVTGNLTLNGNTDWNGIVLVGGTVTSNGNNTVYGATFSGLNIMVGIPVGINALGNGNKTYQYDSCQIAAATANLGGWQQMGNAWVDNWPSY